MKQSKAIEYKPINRTPESTIALLSTTDHIKNLDVDFENVEHKLEFGKWYKSSDALVFNEGKPEKYLGYRTFKGYGFHDSEWICSKSNVDLYNGWGLGANWTLATPSEVKQALINEAKKRGFVDEVIFKPINAEYQVKRNGNTFGFLGEANQLLYCNYLIFKEGIWAEIIEETPIKEEEIIDWDKSPAFISLSILSEILFFPINLAQNPT